MSERVNFQSSSIVNGSHTTVVTLRKRIKSFSIVASVVYKNVLLPRENKPCHTFWNKCLYRATFTANERTSISRAKLKIEANAVICIHTDMHTHIHTIIRTLTVTYDTLQKDKRSSVLNLPKQRQVCPSLFFQFNMRISVIYGTLRVSCKRVLSVLSTFSIKFLWRITYL